MEQKTLTSVLEISLPRMLNGALVNQFIPTAVDATYGSRMGHGGSHHPPVMQDSLHIQMRMSFVQQVFQSGNGHQTCIITWRFLLPAIIINCSIINFVTSIHCIEFYQDINKPSSFIHQFVKK